MTPHTLQRPPDPGEAQKVERPGGAGRFEGAREEDESRQYEGAGTVIPVRDDACRKRLDTLRARVALWGGQLHETTDDRERPAYIVVRWALTKAFTSLDELEAWLTFTEAR